MQTITVRVVYANGRSEIRQARKPGNRLYAMRAAIQDFRIALPGIARIRAFRCAETM